MIPPDCCDITGNVLYRGGFADIRKGNYSGQDVAVKVIRTYSDGDLQKIIGVSHWSYFTYHNIDRIMQRFCKEVVTWKFLRHPNVLPLRGVTRQDSRLAMISNWMADGNINEFVKSHPEVDRLDLVGSRSMFRYFHFFHNRKML
jgi:hypothetical protein